MKTLAPLVLLLGVLGSVQVASAADQPLLGAKLLLQRKGVKEKLVLVVKDPALLFPGVGSADDPGTGAPGGATIELFSASDGSATLAIPAGVGVPGWRVRTGAHPAHKYINPASPGGPSVVRSMQIQQFKRLTLTSRSAGLPLAVAQGAVGVRVTTGGIRNCALFGPASVVKDVAGKFLAKKAAAPVDCDDATLGAPALSACGDTVPTCNGACAPGEECASTYAGHQCVCLPIGSTPCGSPGAPTCGGACPNGQACNPAFRPISDQGPVSCACGVQGCGNGFAFGIDDFGQGGCFPLLCAGTYPTCGGACGDGGVCSPLNISFVGATMCICALPASCCGGGYECGPGDVCTLNPSCSCSPP